MKVTALLLIVITIVSSRSLQRVQGHTQNMAALA